LLTEPVAVSIIQWWTHCVVVMGSLLEPYQAMKAGSMI